MQQLLLLLSISYRSTYLVFACFLEVIFKQLIKFPIIY